MSKRCPPGVFCLENITIFTIFFLIIVFGIFLFGYQNKINQMSDAVVRQTNNIKKLN